MEDTRASDPKQHTAALSVLDVLRAPKPSSLNRKSLIEAVVVNTDAHRLHRRPHALSQRKLPRSKEFPGVCRGTLFCNACREELHVKAR